MRHSSTSSNLIRHIQLDDPDAWKTFVSLYGSLIYSWGRRLNLSREDSADLVQDILQKVVGKIEGYEHQSFRGWLWTMTLNHVRNLQTRKINPATAVGGSDFQSLLEQYPEELSSEMEFNESKNEVFLLHRTLELIRDDFSERTWQAFWKLAIEKYSMREIATQLEMSPEAVRHAKFRVLSRLRDELNRI